MVICLVKKNKLLKLKLDKNKGFYNGWNWKIIAIGSEIMYGSLYNVYIFELSNTKTKEIFQDWYKSATPKPYASLDQMVDVILYNHQYYIKQM